MKQAALPLLLLSLACGRDRSEAPAPPATPAAAADHRDEPELGCDFLFSYGTAPRAFHQIRNNPAGTLRIMGAANEDLLVAGGGLGAGAVRANDFEIVHEETAALVRVDVFLGIREIRKLGK